jgi:voltage-gated potassium channel
MGTFRTGKAGRVLLRAIRWRRIPAPDSYGRTPHHDTPQEGSQSVQVQGIEPFAEQATHGLRSEAPRVFACEESVAAAYKPKKKRKLTLAGFWEAINSNNNFLIFLIVVGLLCAIAVGTYIFEEGVNDAIRSLWDTLWYTIVTLTTVGYGDKYPITVGGKLLGIVMMVLGVASVGIVTGRIASFLVDKQIKARGGLIVMDKKKGHFVICGWKPELETILEKILTIDPDLRPADLVLVNDANPQEIDHIRSLPRYKTVKFIKGDYIDEKVLQRANIRGASRVLILADSSKIFTMQEVDSRTVMTAISINNMNKNVYMCAELIDEKFVKYLKVANCDEIILTREYSRELLANAASASGISHIAAELLNPLKRGLMTVEFKSSFIGKHFRDLQEHYRYATGDIVIGLLENTGNIYHRKKEALAEAQKTPDISKLVENLQFVKKLFPNNPILNPGDDYIIKHHSKAIIVTCNTGTRE